MFNNQRFPMAIGIQFSTDHLCRPLALSIDIEY